VKYAHIERERKFLLASEAADLIKGLPYKTITDHYIKNTQMRFRTVTDGDTNVYKLTQKADSSEGRAQITTIYLKEFEFKLLNIFDSVSVKKTRFIKNYDDFVVGVDQYLKGSDEVWLAEVEFNSDEEMKSFIPPFNYLNEVTDNADYNGYHLALRFEAISREHA